MFVIFPCQGRKKKKKKKKRQTNKDKTPKESRKSIVALLTALQICSVSM